MPRLLQIHQVEDPERFLAAAGSIFRRFVGHDSGCTSLGVVDGGARYFVKYSTTPAAADSLRRAVAVNHALSHAALPPLRNVIHTPGGLMLIYDWADGELLRQQRTLDADGSQRTHNARDRFRALPAGQIIAVLNLIFDVHAQLADCGFIAVDFYDGCILYDFEQAKLHVCDLDEYRPGPFVLERDRLPGSTRFMAPEEFIRGSTIDQVTNVFTLGRTALILLGDGTTSLAAWKGSRAMHDVAVRATDPHRSRRYGSVRSFVDCWQSTTATAD